MYDFRKTNFNSLKVILVLVLKLLDLLLFDGVAVAVLDELVFIEVSTRNNWNNSLIALKRSERI